MAAVSAPRRIQVPAVAPWMAVKYSPAEASRINAKAAPCSLASRLMGSLTKKVTSAFFDCVRKKIEG